MALTGRFIFSFLICIHCSWSAQFSITDETYPNSNGPNVLLKKLSNLDSNESVSIIYSPGGRLEAIELLSLSKGGTPISMISGHNGNASAIYDNAHYKGCALMPWANRIANASYTFYGKQYVVPINEPSRSDALHGFLANQTFTVENQSITANFAELTLSVTFSKALNNLYPGYPFEFTVRITYTLNRTSYFNVHIEAQNTGDAASSEALPFYAGWHPYFNVENVSQSLIELDSNCNYVHLDCGSPPQTAPLIPTGYSEPWTLFDGKNAIGVAVNNTQGMPTYYDDAFRVVACQDENGRDDGQMAVVRNRIIDPLRNNTFVLWQESKRFAFNQLYTGLAYQTGEQAIAFEPQSASTNAYNNGDHLTVLYPGQVFRASFGFYVE